MGKTSPFVLLILYFFSSLKPKAQSFSDRNLPFVRRRKLFIFSSLSPDPLGQFQTNLAQSILGWRRFKSVQMKGQVLFQIEIIKKNGEKALVKKFFSPEPLGQFQLNLAQSIIGWREFKFVLIWFIKRVKKCCHI